jgi:hypothetical protein
MTKENSTRKIGGGLSPITYGRYSSDWRKTTEEIVYHCDIRDSSTSPEAKAREQRIIDKRVAHLRELEKKLGLQEK